MSDTSPKPKKLVNPRHLLRTLLMLDDTDHSIALGTAIGIGLGMTPTVGIQMILVGIVAFCTHRLFHFNRIAAIVGVYISNPLTMIPIYWFLYEIGTLFVGGDVSHEQFSAIFQYESFAGWWETVKQIVISIGWPMLIGTAIVAPICGVVTYPVTRFLIRWLKPNRPSSDRTDSSATLPAEPVTTSGSDGEL